VTQLLVEHAPHLAFVVVGVVAFFWTAYRKPRARPDRASANVPGRRLAPNHPARATVSGQERDGVAREISRPSVRRAVARRGLLALGPLLGALGTGAILYGVNIVGRPAPAAVIWAHVGISVLALLLVGYKLADLGASGLRRAVLRQQMPQLLSAILGVLSVPLLVSGIDLLLAPGTASFAAYSHLIASAWWTGLLLWHLRRYVGPSLRALLDRDGAGLTPHAHAGPDVPVWPPPRPRR
jgi:hypothetical protein